MKKNIFSCTAFAVIFTTLGCQSTSGFLDKSAEIQNLEQQQNLMVTNQEDVLAPEQYQQFSESLKDAKKLNAEHKDATQEVQKAQQLEQIIRQKNKPTKAVLAETLTVRRKALDAGAGETETFQKIDKDLKSATQDAAEGDLRAIEKERVELKNRYSNVEGDALVAKAIGANVKQFAELKDQKVQAVAPQTYARVESKLTSVERSIRADRYNVVTITAARTVADRADSRCLRHLES